MKTPPNHSRPSLACRLVRLRAALTGRRPSHADACPFCQKWFALEESIDEALTRESRAVANHPAPEGLEPWIMASVRNRQRAKRRNSVRRSAGVRGFLVTGACAAAVAVVAALLFVRDPVPSRAPGGLVASEETLKPEELAAVVAAVDTLPRRLGNTVAPTATRFAESNPLLGEVDLLYADAKAAIEFLAMNFLPEASADGSVENGREQQGLSG